MKRQWKVDQSQPVGHTYVWKGNPEKLPAPWIVVDYRDYFPSHTTLSPGYYMIKKLSNLEWLEYKFNG
jgi:hypothetical protein